MADAEVVVLPTLAPEALLFRAYRQPSCFDSKKQAPKPKTFYRRPDESGLSVSLTPEAVPKALPGAAGSCYLTVLQVSESQDPLAVFQDEEDHAEVRGVPVWNPDDEKAIRIAKYLTRCATHHSLLTPAAQK